MPTDIDAWDEQLAHVLNFFLVSGLSFRFLSFFYALKLDRPAAVFQAPENLPVIPSKKSSLLAVPMDSIEMTAFFVYRYSLSKSILLFIIGTVRYVLFPVVFSLFSSIVHIFSYVLRHTVFD